MRWRIHLQVRYRRRADLAVTALALAALLVGLLGALLWTPRSAIASPTLAESSIPLQYYLTTGFYAGDQALLACAPGYHMASLWELLDTSNLRYNTSLGRTGDDSGQGPPYGSGWIRTGDTSGTGSPGEANCQAWTSGLAADIGTTVSLPSDWTAGEEDLLGWNAGSAICSLTRPVWCVGMSRVYLPLILRGYVG
jgi:hypothetical protein